VHDQAARRAGDRGVGQDGAKVGATEDGLFERASSRRHVASAAASSEPMRAAAYPSSLGSMISYSIPFGRFDVQGGDGLADQVLVRALVDLATDDLVDQLEDDLADPRRRLVDGALARRVHLGVGVGEDAVVLGLSATAASAFT
jgi:hypothetical protein